MTTKYQGMYYQAVSTLLWMAMIPHVSSQDFAENEVRIVGGTRPSTGVVELYLNGKWGILCSTTWTIIEADVVCRQSGYGGALINEGVLSPDYPDSRLSPMPIHKGTVNCTSKFSARGPDAILGCRRSLVTEEGPKCGWPNSVACTRHQAELQVRLFGGHSNNSGRVEVLYGGIWWGICSAEWNLTDASVVCQQLGFKDSADFSDSATVNYPDGHDDRFYLMSNVSCAGEESNIGLCERAYGTRTCASGNYAMATCAPLKPGHALNKTVLVTLICLLLIPAILLVLFLVVFCLYRKRKESSAKEQKSTIYKPVNQKESMDMQHVKNGNDKK